MFIPALLVVIWCTVIVEISNVGWIGYPIALTGATIGAYIAEKFIRKHRG